MKKLFFGLIATVFLSAPIWAQAKEDAPFIQIEFGRKSRNCAGFGICVFKITIPTAADLITVITALAKPDGKIKAEMTNEFYKNHASAFQNGYLVVEEDYKIDLETTRRLGVADGYTIKTGRYQIVFDKSTNTYNCTF